MLKRLLIGFFLAFIVVIASDRGRSVSAILLTETERAAASATSLVIETNEPKRGNKLVRVLKAPFKAIGRLFGRGKKDDNKLHRLSEKDVEKFETSGVTRIVDAQTSPAAVSSVEGNGTTPATTVAEAIDNHKAMALKHLERGRQSLKNGSVNEAIGAFSVAASYDPKLREAWNLLGVAYGMKGLRNLALNSFEESLEGDNDNPEHLNNLGYFLYQNGEYEEATKYLKKAVKSAPKEERFWNNLGLAQAQRGKFDDAYKSFARAMGEFDGRLNVATRLQRLGQEKEAIKHLEKARELRPNSQEALSQLITLYERAGKNEQALQARITLVSLRTTAKAPPEERK